ncbi:MAG: HAMP domain-containing protein [Chitinispirillaceae bacterium]|nr:HAMP domain-containing protein [Chitinispirillaceae bacterium]
MRLNIATKFFLGFLCVIVLNALFFVIVGKTDNVNGIVDILKRQNDVKNKLLRLKTLHRVQGPSIISYQRIGRSESVQNFRGINQNVQLLIDTIVLSIDSIITIDSRLAPKERFSRNQVSMIKLQQVMQSIASNNDLYSALFEQLVKMREGRVPVAEPDSVRKKMMDTINGAEYLIAADLDSAESIISNQTEVRIRDIGADVLDVKQVTIVILSGVALISLIFGFIFSRSITNSLRRLKEAASQIGKADFNINPAGYPNDEIGDLSTAFFDMAVDLRNKQEEIIKSRRLAAIGEVVASVNHEINNPLMIISGNAQFLEMSMNDYPPEMKERIRTILEETDRISRVTRKLREIKKPITEDYTSSGEQMINLDKSTQ